MLAFRKTMMTRWPIRPLGCRLFGGPGWWVGLLLLQIGHLDLWHTLVGPLGLQGKTDLDNSSRSRGRRLPLCQSSPEDPPQVQNHRVPFLACHAVGPLLQNGGLGKVQAGAGEDTLV